MTERTALLIGAAGGILQNVARGLADEGHPLVLFDKNEEAVNRLGAELSSKTKVEVIVGDITDIPAAERQLTAVVDQHAPSILVNGVGGDTRVIRYSDLTTEHFNESYLENVVSTFIAIKVCAPRMRRRVPRDAARQMPLARQTRTAVRATSASHPARMVLGSAVLCARRRSSARERSV